MKFSLVVVSGVLAMFASLSWSVDCLPQFYSETFSSSSVNGERVRTYGTINNNGRKEYFFNGQRVDGPFIGRGAMGPFMGKMAGMGR